METIEGIWQQGVGATAEARLLSLGPLIEYYEREMGELPGRLMIAISFLNDVQSMPGWSSLMPEFRASVEQAQALAVSVMIRLLNMQAQAGCDCGKSDDSNAELQRFLDNHFTEGMQG